MTAIRRVFDRPPFSSPWVASVIGRFALPTWFIVESILGTVQVVRDPTYLFFDGRLYLEATRAWLAGNDPWNVQIAGNYYAAPPPSLLPLAPLAILPEQLGISILAVAVAVAAVATVRMLRLPWWWLAFPPLVQCVLAANVQALLVPLILLPGGAVAGLLKIYAGLPLVVLGKWRAVALLLAILVVTIPVLPWATYIADLPTIAANLAEQSKFTLPTLLLAASVPFVIAGLIVVGRYRAAWLVVPAIWPSQQFYYGTITMPTRSKIVGAIVALPVAGNGLIALGVLAIITFVQEGRHDWRTYLQRWRGDPDLDVSDAATSTGSTPAARPWG